MLDLAPADIEGIRAAVRDYYEGWYSADPERMRRCLHPRLVKRNVDQDGAGAWTLDDMGAEDMVAATARRASRTPLPGHEIEVQDGHGRSASVRGSSVDYIDYLHLGKFDEQWLIVSALWEDLRPRSGQA
jgi:putative lumazine-binding protein